MPTVQDVKNYWENHPLHTYEFQKPGTPEYFENLDAIKREDIEKFSGGFSRFDAYAGKKLLDVGCGPGWFVVQYAKGGAQVTGVDLTSQAVWITTEHLKYRGLTAAVQQANAEALPFSDRHFDVVVSMGVLHHTPDFKKAIAECYRVLKPGGESKIALYHKGILHHQPFFGMMKILMKKIRMKHPGADLARTAETVDEFVRQYDGEGNPVGIAKSTEEWTAILRETGFQVRGHELHYFPKRFIPFSRWIPDFLHWAMDRCFGTLIYFKLEKPASGGRL